MTVAVHGPVDPSRARDLCQHVQGYLEAGAREIICEVTGSPDLSLVNTLARLLLTTTRSGAGLNIRTNECGRELAALLGYLGLDPLAELLGPLKPGRQPEAGE